MRASIKTSTEQQCKRIVIAISGGVDSSVAAYLLKKGKRKSDELIGLHMNNWNPADEGGDDADGSGIGSSGSFCVQSEEDALDSQSVCNLLDMKMRRVSFAGEYWTGVFEPFLEEIKGGRIVNPDVGCNSIVKFGAMRDYAMKHLQADYIATGHYARLWYRDDTNSSTSPYTNSNKLALPPIDVQESLADTPEEEWISSWGGDDVIGTTNGKGGFKRKTPILLAGADASKDQSYFLSGVKGCAFTNTLFPLGDLVKKTASNGLYARDPLSSSTRKEPDTKNESVRDIALMAGLPTASKKESMGICFIGKRKFPDFIAEYLGYEPSGDFVDVDTGEIVGKHGGSSYLTIGQGAKISGASRKWFITKRDLESNTVFVCNDTHHPALYSDELCIQVEDFNWIAGEIPQPMKYGQQMRALCRTRHLQPMVPCQVSWNSSTSTFIVKFDTPVRAITPGQTAAIYVCDGLICLGGGPIWKRGPSFHELGLPLPSILHPAGHNDLSVLR